MASTQQFDVANLFGVKGIVAVVTGGTYKDIVPVVMILSANDALVRIFNSSLQWKRINRGFIERVCLRC